MHLELYYLPLPDAGRIMIVLLFLQILELKSRKSVMLVSFQRSCIAKYIYGMSHRMSGGRELLHYVAFNMPP